MKKAIKFGFGFSLGIFMFKLCNAITDDVLDKVMKRKFNEDEDFRLRIKLLSPTLYARYCKYYQDTAAG